VRKYPGKNADKNLPVGGAPDVLAAAYTEPYKNGQFRMRAGESYIEMVRFTPNGVKIETVNAYGASSKPSSKHYADQMEIFVKQQLKPMTLDREAVFREAERIYSPK
jgi:acyl-homoserine-lactone acylase